jgi:hypothetical protein
LDHIGFNNPKANDIGLSFASNILNNPAEKNINPNSTYVIANKKSIKNDKGVNFVRRGVKLFE